MNLFKLSSSYLRRRLLNTSLNILLLSFGIATVSILLLFSNQLEENLYKNAEGVDVVVGAKGSPIQLILSSIYHVDTPTGNIDLDDARTLMRNPMVESAIPLALGDNVRGYRIVGTTTDYLEKYDAQLNRGTLWDHELELVAGAGVAESLSISVGDTLVSSHGLAGGGQAHDEKTMIVTGILEETGTVTDRLLLTGVETMWAIHDYEEEEGAGAHSEDEDHHDRTEITDESYLDPANENRQITSMLISYRNPLAAAQFPRFVNERTSMQAAAPAFEITRLLELLGVGLDTLEIFAYILILASVLGIFIALVNSMKERQYDLAIMRTLGGSRFRLFMQIILEGLMISIAGGLLGLILGHSAVHLIGEMFSEARQFDVSGIVFIPEEVTIVLLVVGVGIVASIVPAIRAYNTDIAETLSKK